MKIRGRGKPAKDGLDVYMRSAGKTPLMSAAEEKALAREIIAAQCEYWGAILSELCGRVLAVHRLGKDMQITAYDIHGQDIEGIVRKIRSTIADRRWSEAFEKEVYELCGHRGDEYSKAIRVRKRVYLAKREAFARANLRLVMSVARSKHFLGMDVDDVLQNGNIGLMMAIDRFDPSCGTRFSTYAVWWIGHLIHRSWDETYRAIRIPVGSSKLHAELIKLQAKHRARYGCEASRELVEEQLGEHAAELLDLDAGVFCRPASLDASLSSPAMSWTERPTMGSAMQSDAPSPLDYVEHADVRRWIEERLATLSPRAEVILRRRFGLDDDNDHTLSAAWPGISRERVRQIEHLALAAMGARADKGDFL